MPRNKYPEVTEKAILDTAKRLFLEHGYEHVTLQDIAEACGLTRGAIYHHFHGKEEMLDAVTTYMFHETVPCLEIQEDTSRNGLEKLQRLIIASVSNREQLQMYRMLSRTFYQSPKLVCAYLLSCRTSVVPMTRTFLEEGVSDGSITVDSPQIAAEVVARLYQPPAQPSGLFVHGPRFSAQGCLCEHHAGEHRPPPDQRPGLRCFLRHGRCAVRGGTDLASIRCPLGHLILQIYIQSERMYKEVSL